MDLHPSGRPPTWFPPDETRRAAVGRNESNYSFFEGSSKYELILRRFNDFLEFLHLDHRDLPRGESVQLLTVANILSSAIIFRSESTKPKFYSQASYPELLK